MRSVLSRATTVEEISKTAHLPKNLCLLQMFMDMRNCSKTLPFGYYSVSYISLNAADTFLLYGLMIVGKPSFKEACLQLLLS